jgi:hypothetical protein
LIPTVLLLHDFLSLKNDINVHSKSNKQKNLGKNSFKLASRRSMTKIEGSGADPDPLVLRVTLIAFGLLGSRYLYRMWEKTYSFVDAEQEPDRLIRFYESQSRHNVSTGN